MTPSSVKVGKGVPRVTPTVVNQEGEKPSADTKATPVIEDAVGNVIWDTKPSKRDQLDTPGEVKYQNRKARVFNLSDSSDLAEYNTLLEGMASTISPTTKLFAYERNFHNGIYYVYIDCATILYKVHKDN